MVRNPTDPRSTVISSARPAIRIFRLALYNAGSPWVCGHHRSISLTCKWLFHVAMPLLFVSVQVNSLRSMRSCRASCRCTVSMALADRTAVCTWQLTIPALPLTATVSDEFMMSIWRRRSSQMSFQGPTTAAVGDQPGVRPNKVVRNQRSCWCSTMGARQRGLFRRTANCASSALKQITNVLPVLFSVLPTSHACATNMLLLLSRS